MNGAALNRITVAWERKRSSTLLLPELFERIRLPVDPAFLEPWQTRYTGQNGMFYAHFIVRGRDRNRGLFEQRSEIAFDRKSLYVATLIDGKKPYPPVIARITPLERLGKERPDGYVWDPEYFQAAGFDVPHTVATLLELPRSRVLALLEQGARMTKFWVEHSSQDPQLTVLEMTTGDRTYRFDLDSTLNYAVRGQEEQLASGSLAVVTTNSDFVRLPDTEVWLPRRSRAEWYSWPSIPDQFSPTPLVVVDSTVSEFNQLAVPAERFRLDYNSTPGAFIGDGRLRGTEKSADGTVSYFVPIDPADLEDGVRAVMESRKLNPDGHRSPVLRGIAIGLSLGGIVAAFGILAWRRAAHHSAEVSSDS